MLTRNNLSVRASEASSKHRSSEIDSPDKTLIRESWKIQIAGLSPTAFRGQIRSAALHRLYTLL